MPACISIAAGRRTHRAWTALLLLATLWCCATGASGSTAARRQLEEHVSLARLLVEQQPDVPEAHLQLATVPFCCHVGASCHAHNASRSTCPF